MMIAACFPPKLIMTGDEGTRLISVTRLPPRDGLFCSMLCRLHAALLDSPERSRSACIRFGGGLLVLTEQGSAFLLGHIRWSLHVQGQPACWHCTRPACGLSRVLPGTTCPGGGRASLPPTALRSQWARCHTSHQGRVGGEETQEPVGKMAWTGWLCLRPDLLAVFCCSSWGSIALPGSSVIGTQNGSVASRMGEGSKRAAKERAEGNLGLLPMRLSALSPRLGILGSHLLPP